MTPKHILNMHKIGRKVPPGCVYVGRPSVWGNPFNTHKVEDGVIYTREAAIEGFRQYARKRLEIDPNWLDPLRDATALACWCSPQPCHAEVLLELMNENNALR